MCTPNSGRASLSTSALIRLVLVVSLCLFSSFIAAVDVAVAQNRKNSRLPSAEKILDKYWKAIGGKKRAAAIRDASFEWTLRLNDEAIGLAKTQTRAPDSWRSELTFGNGEVVTAANASSAWSRGLDGELRTLTGAEAASVKLQALLEASHLVSYKRSNVAARSIASPDSSTEPSYAVEFSTRPGGRLVYHFSRSTGLILKTENPARNVVTQYSDYREVDGLRVAHEVRTTLAGKGQLTSILQAVRYNLGTPISLFDAPVATVFDVPELLRVVVRNQDEVEKRFTEYSFLQKETDREISSKGEVKKETVRLHEVFPIPYREPVMKLISENGVPLSPERAAKEGKRVEEELLKAERERGKDEAKDTKRRADRARKKAARGESEDEDVEVSQFLKVCEFVSPRRERFRDRDAVVFDFRPRAGFRPQNRQEELISKLVGVVWIDPEDKQVMRLEARLAEGFKMAGGLLLSLKPGASVVIEQTRMNEGLWLPRMAQINLSVKVLLFGGGDMNKTLEWTDYKHFKGDVKEYRLDNPKDSVSTEQKP
jgi:hypothetical protein